MYNTKPPMTATQNWGQGLCWKRDWAPELRKSAVLSGTSAEPTAQDDKGINQKN